LKKNPKTKPMSKTRLNTQKNTKSSKILEQNGSNTKKIKNTNIMDSKSDQI
jgi:hypothetical protein